MNTLLRLWAKVLCRVHGHQEIRVIDHAEVVYVSATPYSQYDQAVIRVHEDHKECRRCLATLLREPTTRR